MITNRPLYSDNELFLFVQSKTRKHFNIIYDHYSSIVYGFLLHSGLPEKYATDILEQTFVTAWNSSIPTPSHPKISFLSWILRLAIDSTKNYLIENNRRFIINYKNYFSIHVEFTDALNPSVCSA